MGMFRRCRQLPLALGMPLEIISKFVKKKKSKLIFIHNFIFPENIWPRKKLSWALLVD